MQLFAHTLALGLTKLRKTAPMVQCISNLVALDFVYNVMLALGVTPAIAHAGEEIADFSDLAQSLMINTGTLSGHGALAMLEAAKLANEKKRPWVLDPGGVGQTKFRDKTIYELMSMRPTVLRAKAPEIVLMASHFGFESRSVETGRTSEDNVDAARLLAEKTGSVVVMTGATDIITDNTNTLRIMNGHPLMSKVAGIGSALSATIASFCAVEDNPIVAAAIAVGIYDIVGEIVGPEVEGPAAFRSAFIDRMFIIDANTALRRLKVL